MFYIVDISTVRVFIGAKNMNKLFIIGNGFDIQHGFHTNYKYFKSWLGRRILDEYSDTTYSPNIFTPCEDDEDGYFKRIAFVKMLCDHCNSKANWSNFEADLANVDIVSTYNNNIDFVLEPEDAFTSRFDDVRSDNAEILKETIEWIPSCFKDWIDTVRITKPKGKVLLSRKFDEDSLFFSFNYTETLESLYGIDSSRICYIHGKRQGYMPLIIGHGANDYPEQNDNDDYIAAELQRVCFDMLKKPVKDIIRTNHDFFERINDEIKDIYCYGISYGKVDYPYLIEIIKRANRDAIWHLSDYDDEEKRKEIADLLRKIGVRGEITSFDHGLIKRKTLLDL